MGNSSIAEEKKAEFALLGSFITEYDFLPNLDPIILDLTRILKSENSFDDINGENFYWSFYNGEAYFECVEKIAFFENLMTV